MASYKKIDHIGIAVSDLERAIPLWRDVLGLPYEGRERVETEGTEVAFFRIGEVRIELVAPLGEGTPVAKFLAKRGEGVHHLCFAVDDVAARLEALKDKKVPLIDEHPKPGAHGCQVAFVHPKGLSGVLLELSQPAKDTEH
jgi:methylmalonyl-CoA epimerase